MKNDCEVPVHDILGRQMGMNQRHKKSSKLCFYFNQISGKKGDSMRKIIQQIDERNWRALEYFRMLDKQSQLQLDNKTVTLDIRVRNFHRNLPFFSIYIYILEIGCRT